ncbi:hypothetical protein T484DRAFT_1911353, partial [Baffinella frigidus]
MVCAHFSLSCDHLEVRNLGTSKFALAKTYHIGSTVTADARAVTGNSADPRTPDNLLDGVNCTCDDLHVWLAPFTQGATHRVRIELDAESTLSMIRIWNYNTSRIHAARGARRLTLRLDSVPIFRGDVKQAPGELKSAEAAAEVILFTQEPVTLRSLVRSMDELREESGGAHVQNSETIAAPAAPPPRPASPGGESGRSKPPQAIGAMGEQRPASGLLGLA